MKNLKFVGIAVLILAIGCANSKEKNLVGHYKASIVVTPGKENDLSTQMEKGLLESQSLDIRADKTFSLTMLFTYEGTWAYADNRLTLTTTKMAGSAADAQGDKAVATHPEAPVSYIVGDDGSLTPERAVGRASNVNFSFVKEGK